MGRAEALARQQCTCFRQVRSLCPRYNRPAQASPGPGSITTYGVTRGVVANKPTGYGRFTGGLEELVVGEVSSAGHQFEVCPVPADRGNDAADGGRRVEGDRGAEVPVGDELHRAPGG